MKWGSGQQGNTGSTNTFNLISEIYIKHVDTHKNLVRTCCSDSIDNGQPQIEIVNNQYGSKCRKDQRRFVQSLVSAITAKGDIEVESNMLPLEVTEEGDCPTSVSL